MRDVSAKLPIVILTNDNSPDDLESSDPERLQVVKKDRAVIVAPTLDFSPHVYYGLKTLNSDERKIPLKWPAIQEKDFETLPLPALQQIIPPMEDTLSVAAVRQYDPGALLQQTIRSLEAQGVHPFTSFLKRSEIPTDSPIDLICDHDHARDFDWRNTCRESHPDSMRLRELRNRVVVIGQNLSKDIHRTVIGPVPGVILQANYIESLLDDRYLKPSSLWVEIPFSIAWLFVIEWLFQHFETRPAIALLLSAAATALLWLLTYDFVILQLGRYIVLWPPSAVAMVGRYLMLKAQ